MSFCASPKAVLKKRQVYLSLSLSLHCRRWRVKESIQERATSPSWSSRRQLSGAKFGPNFPKVCFVLFVRRNGHDASEVEAANLCGFVDLGRRDVGDGWILWSASTTEEWPTWIVNMRTSSSRFFVHTGWMGRCWPVCHVIFHTI